MAQGSRKPAAGPPAKKLSTAVKLTIAANNEAARKLHELRSLARVAAKHAFHSNVGNKRTLQLDQFKDSELTRNMVQPLLTQLKAGKGRIHTGGEVSPPCELRMAALVVGTL